MLENLERIEWSALEDAYGPSTRTPGLIRALTSTWKWKREKALYDLYSNINHQGTIYAASVAAVPFLLEIVESNEVEDRSPALQLLQGISTGTSYHETHASLIFYREKSKTPEWQAMVAEEKGWAAEIHKRISAGVAAIVGVLRTGRTEERVAAGSLLATLSDNAAAQEALLAAAADPEPKVSAAAITAIGFQDDVAVGTLQQCFDRAQNELVRTVAAIQILGHADGKPPAAAVEQLMKHLRTPQPDLRKAYEALPDVGAFLGDVAKALAGAPRDAIEAAFPLVYEQVKGSPYPLNESENFGLLLLAAMLKPPVDHNWVASEMTQQQRQTIRLIADRAWRIERGVRTWNGNVVDLFGRIGLPAKREGIFELLAGTPEGVQTPQEEAKWSAKGRRRWWRRVFGQ
jgi:hypothetical protein